ncbi:sigma-70 family RNA polymerase sigma factor [Corynebacterium tapiri]|uniref:Sigma-70 family RNA polymerase sigma factor n=1 Tax=Corynebacterium tapiri TaxID=1448266 RepID=A0A5C4U4K3_9CORY|nr:sigma-70 family RNA polymerase sigma factor [Corynebacterium tapiri]TNL98501.1 sigma-70 family RNA polymerase sigma factor [Corynebacterium tapiri]
MSEFDEELAALVPAARQGDRRALKRLISLIYPKVLRYARARIGGGKSPTPEDVAQDVCLAVNNALPTYADQGKPFMAFVYGVAFNKVADAHRTLARDRLIPQEEMPDEVDVRHNPEETALTLDGSNRVRALLDCLNDKARDILILRIFVGLSAEETAEIVGSTPGAVRVAQHRALATLRKNIDTTSLTG